MTGAAPASTIRAAAALRRASLRRRRRLPDLTVHGWDVLLELLLAESVGRPVNVKSAQLAAGRTATTGLRELARLEARGMIERTPGRARDRRLIFVTLTASGRARLCACLEAIRVDLAPLRPGALL